jgi:hypothetical protein
MSWEVRCSNHGRGKILASSNLTGELPGPHKILFNGYRAPDRVGDRFLSNTNLRICGAIPPLSYKPSRRRQGQTYLLFIIMKLKLAFTSSGDRLTSCILLLLRR